MSDLSQLIRINKNIEKQNNEIIRLLKKIAGESEDDSLVEIVDEGVIETISRLDFGEVYFFDNDLFKLSIKTNELMINNLTGTNESTDYSLAHFIANKSIEKNQKIGGYTAILTDSSKGNLPEALRICVEKGITKVYVPKNQVSELISAPSELSIYININIYQTCDDLAEKIFNE